LTAYEKACNDLRQKPRTWLVTGVAGFIGSNLLGTLLRLGQRVVGLDDFSTGSYSNLNDVLRAHSSGAQQFRFIEGDICNVGTCLDVTRGVDYVLHQAAIASVPRSILDPIITNQVNVDGTLNVLIGARDAGVRRVVFASSCAVYGTAHTLPLTEDLVGAPLSPYAVSKLVDEQYAKAFTANYQLETVGLRYFNVFGPRQDPLGGYAAVIPQWIHQIANGERCRIYGDGGTSRDFVSVGDVVQANILAATSPSPQLHSIYNVGSGHRTSLNELHTMLAECSTTLRRGRPAETPLHFDYRAGDIRHSQADIGLIRRDLGYLPTTDLREALEVTMRWYVSRSPRDTLPKAPLAVATGRRW
jgi:UDP-N-acetylglucosamine 4-epimerase